jgi:hypothetical protein
VATNACTGRAHRPAKIVIACATGQFYADHLRYGAYGGQRARATGDLGLDDCTPNCAAGRFPGHPRVITLEAIERCAGHLFYTRIAWAHIGRSPLPARSGSVSIAPFRRCSPRPR